jgi:Cysteine sulfinate desulfinase/cysteine desulfurase and related enzymes
MTTPHAVPDESRQGTLAGREPVQPVYLDYQATTPTDPRVVSAMLPYFAEVFGNPHSRSHRFGLEAEAAVERARKQVARSIGADAKEIVFTSGATEANNLAIKGVGRFHRDRRAHVVTCAIEHKCVLESCRSLEQDGFTVTRLPVQASGRIDLNQLDAAVRDDTALVSVMAANNEIGTLQPLAEIAAICHRKGAYFHTDAAQAVGKIHLDVRAMDIDLLSLSGHKLYGPKGIGALYVRRRPRVRLEPLFSGGGQERGLRSGTLPAPLCVGLGAACDIAAASIDEEIPRLRRLRDRLFDGLVARLTHVYVNGGIDQRLAGNLNLRFPGVDSEELMARLGDLAMSSGSACTSASIEPSYVLRAIGLDAEAAHASVRIGLGRYTTEQEIDYAIERLAEEVTRQRHRSAPVFRRRSAAED